MKTKAIKVTIRDLIDGYKDDSDKGGAVVGYSGRLNVRPAYQREFIYEKAEEKEAVIHSVANGFPLNVMYWADDGAGNFEILDGQQRTLCICKFCADEFSSKAFSANDYIFYNSLPKDEKEKFLNYELMVYHCLGNDSDKLKWFETINIAGKQLNEQERLNAVYSCAWTTDARKHFSNQNAVAVEYKDKYLSESITRQECLAKAIKWASGDGDVAKYMSERKKNKEKSAQALWEHFESIFEWVEKVFPEHRKDMKGLDWGRLYSEHKHEKFDSGKLAARAKKLRANPDVKQSGVYEYLLTGDASHINVRSFDKKLKERMYKKQQGKCAFAKKGCVHPKKKWQPEEMEADHIKPWREGGPTNEDNCQMLCKQCNREKGAR